MLKKWYLLSFILSLTLLGVVQQYQNPSANQEIVIQFVDSNSSEVETESSLASISTILKEIGAENISISSKKNGFFHIAYHSDKAVGSIKEILFEKTKIAFNNTPQSSSEKQAKDYSLDIFDIIDGDNSAWDFESQQVQIFNVKSDRSSSPNVFKFPVLVETSKTYIDLKVAYNANQLVVFVSDNTSYNIPEVRAEPLA